MKKGMKLEVYRAFHNQAFIFSVLLGCLITVIHFIFKVFPERMYILGGTNMDFPSSVFNQCMIFDMEGFFSYLYYYAIILIASIPFGVSYFQDLREGYIKNIYVRMNRMDYLIGKYVAVFLSAGTVCVIPLILNLLLTATVIPSLTPQVGTGQFPIIGSRMLAEVYYSTPWLYVTVYLLIDFMIVGFLVCMAMALAKVVYNKYVMLFLPFLIFLILQTVTQFTGLYKWGPFFIMDPSQMYPQDMVTVVSEIVVLFLISFIPYIIMGGKKADAL